ncbi:UDP kinase [Pseudothermotoga hypogea DSM 11164 = NBRC 106472]|uniref:UDP kinase n=1 Tax=Pseudothermotoga hypogea DSM 11164 = NBRC 106472 TaxID=1123384 RepID=A0A0X1KTA4_9THEM|nr:MULTISPECIES: diacylglycerol kinase family protein [Pseudothermotoga]AJC74550.1 UDP kinase [Pseudothermotoga hypogea DSM 11164 = NBRC 106472]MDI6862128.1 diacylglycerol kinase family protein [Pseudothermotoga sp.]
MSETLSSFIHAVEGFSEAIGKERNLKLHFAIGSFVLLISYVLELTANELLWLIFAVFSVIGMELLNTLVESIMDLYEIKPHPTVKFVKDVAAGIVLWYSLFAVVVGVIVLGRAMFGWSQSVGKLIALIFVLLFPTVSLIWRVVSSWRKRR